MSTPAPPPPPGKKQFYYCTDGVTVEGPTFADDLLVMVTRRDLPGATAVCEVGSNDWRPFTDLPDSAFTPQQIAHLPKVMDERNMQDAREMGQAIGSNPVVAVIAALIFGAVVWFVLQLIK